MFDQWMRRRLQDRFMLPKVVGLLGWTSLMLGTHHNNPAPQLLRAPGPPLPPAPIESIHAGHPGAPTGGRWKATRSFRRVPAAGWGRGASLDSAELLTVLKINRVDARHARRGFLMVPDSIGPDLEYSPFPDSLPELSAVPKFILVSREVQAFSAYENGRQVHWGPISSGKAATPTDSGLFFTNWKARTAISTEDSSWVLDWYVNIIALKGVAFHQYALPGRPASHGCVRLLEADARWVYRWTDRWIPGRGSLVAHYGTPVLILGDYDYHARAPWLRLAEDPAADQLAALDVRLALDPYLETITRRTPVIAPIVASRGGAHTPG